MTTESQTAREKLMNTKESSAKFSGEFLQRCAVSRPGSLNSSTPPARHVGGARLTLPGSGGGLGRTVVSGAPWPEEVVGARRRHRRPGQHVTRAPIHAAAAAHGDPEGHVRAAKASGPAAWTRSAEGLLRPLV